MQLEQHDRNGLELLIDTDNGAVFATQSAIARMSNVTESSVRQFLEYKKIEPLKYQAPTKGGFRYCSLLDEEQMRFVLKHYNPNLLQQAEKAGLRVYLYGLAGYTRNSIEGDKRLIDPSKLSRKKILQWALEAEEKAEQIKKKLEEAKPKIEFAEIVQETNDTISIGEFAKLIYHKDTNVGRNKLYRRLRELGIIEKTSCCPYQKYVKMQWFEVSEISLGEGEIKCTPRITGKGQFALLELIQEKGLVSTEEDRGRAIPLLAS